MLNDEIKGYNIKAMRISYLKNFVVLAETLNFTKAAEMLFISQPILSRHITLLEKELGVKLFSRSTHSVELTQEGKMVYETIKTIVDKYETLLNDSAKRAQGKSGSLTIGILYHCIEDHIYLVDAFSSSYPNVSVSLLSFQPKEMIEALFAKQIDIGLTIGYAIPEKKEICHTNILQESMVVMLSGDNHLSSVKQLKLIDIADLPFVLIKKEAWWQEPYVRTLFEKNGINKNDFIYTDQVDTLAYTIHKSNGVSIVPKHLSSMITKNIVFIDIDNIDAYVDISFIYLNDNENPTLQSFLKCSI